MSEGTYVYFVDPPPIPHDCITPSPRSSGRGTIWQCNCGQQWIRTWSNSPLKKKLSEVWERVQP